MFERAGAPFLCAVKMDQLFVEKVLIAGHHAYYQQRHAVRVWLRRCQGRQLRDLQGRQADLQAAELCKRRAARAFARTATLVYGSKVMLILTSRNTVRAHLRHWRTAYSYRCNVRRIIRMLQLAFHRVAVRQWRYNVHIHNQSTMACEKLMVTLRRVDLRSGFQHLRARVANTQRNKTLLILREQFQERRRPVHALRRWRNIVQRVRDVRAGLVRIATQRRLHAMGQVFDAIKGFTFEKKRQRAHNFLAYAFYASKFKARMWKAFVSNVRTRISARPLVCRLKECIALWRDKVNTRIHMKTLEIAAEVHDRCRCLRLCIRAMQQVMRQRMHAQLLQLKAATFRKLVLQQGTFTLWYRYAHQRRLTRGKVYALQIRIAQRHITTAFAALRQRWFDVCADRKARVHYSSRLLRRVLRAWKGDQPATAAVVSTSNLSALRIRSVLHQWARTARDCRQRETVADTLVSQSIAKCRRSMLQEWKLVAKQHQYRRAAALQTEQLCYHNVLYRCWLSWRSAFQEVMETSAAFTQVQRLCNVRVKRNVLFAMIQQARRRKHVRRLVGVAEHTFQMGLKRLAFAELLNVVSVHRLNVLLCTRALQHWQTRSSRQAFAVLRQYARKRVMIKRQKELADRHYAEILTKTAWQAMRLAHQEVMEYAQLLERAYTFRSLKLQHRILAQWKVWVQHRKAILLGSIAVDRRNILRFQPTIHDDAEAQATVPRVFHATSDTIDPFINLARNVTAMESSMQAAAQIVMHAAQADTPDRYHTREGSEEHKQQHDDVNDVVDMPVITVPPKKRSNPRPLPSDSETLLQASAAVTPTPPSLPQPSPPPLSLPLHQSIYIPRAPATTLTAAPRQGTAFSAPLFHIPTTAYYGSTVPVPPSQTQHQTSQSDLTQRLHADRLLQAQELRSNLVRRLDALAMLKAGRSVSGESTRELEVIEAALEAELRRLKVQRVP